MAGLVSVFVGHTGELETFPAGASFVDGALEGVGRGGGAPRNMRYFTSREGRPAAYCREEVARADVYVGVLGFRYGSLVPGTEVSYTEFEFDVATQLGIPRLVFLVDPETPLPRSVSVDPVGGARQDAFRERVRSASGLTVQVVSSPEQLTTLVLQGLQDLKEQTQARIAAGVERERQPAGRPVQRSERFVNAPPMTAPAWFQDRHAETKVAADFLTGEGVRLLQVVGRGGAGKTAMVCRLLKAVEAGRLPDDLGDLPPGVVDGIVYLSPTGAHPVGFEYLFADLTRLLDDDSAHLPTVGKDPAQTPARLMTVLLEAVGARRVVVLLDNLEDHVDPATQHLADASLAEALRALLGTAEHGVKVLATTRVPVVDLLEDFPARAVRLDLDEGLPGPYAKALLRQMDSTGALGLRGAGEDLLDVAVERTRGFPRALEALAAILSANRDTTLEDVLTRAAGVLPERVVSALVGDAYNQLDPLAQHVMQALAVYTVPVPPVAVDFLLQPLAPTVNAGPVLSRLVNMHFARRDQGRYYLHQTDRDYALTQPTLSLIPTPNDAGAAAGDGTWGKPAGYHATDGGVGWLRRRAADYFASTRTPRESWTTLEDLAPQLAEFELRVQAGDYDDAHAVLNEISFDCLQRWGHARLAADLHECLDGQLTDAWARSANHTQLGISYADLGQTQAAIDHYVQALAIDREIGDRRGEANDLGNLGNCYAGLGQTQTAIDHYVQALAINREIGDRQGEANDLGNLGLCYADLGQTQAAFDHHEQALAIDREIGDRRGEANALGNLGLCYAGLGQTQTAIDHHVQALAINREIGDRQGEATALGNLGNCYAGLGQTQAAIDHHVQALAINREIAYRQGEATALGNLGNCYAGLGQTQAAIDHHEQALAIDREIGDRQGEATDLGNLGLCYADLGQTQAAFDHYVQGLAINREIGYRRGEATDLGNLGNCYADLGQTQAAIDHHEQALAINREIGDRQGEATALGNLGNRYAGLGQTQTAIDHHEQALAINREIGDRQGEATALGALGLCYADLGQTQAAIDHHEQALAINREIGDRRGEATALGNLGNRYAGLGQTPAAIDHHEQALAINREIAYRQGEATALGALGLCYAVLGQTQAAIDHHEQALAINREIAYRQGEATALGALGLCYAVLGQTQAAIDNHEQALAINREIGYRRGEATDLGNLGNCYADLGQTQTAIEHHEQALAIAREIGSAYLEACERCYLGEVALDLGRADEAAAHLDQAIEVADQIGSQEIRSQARLTRARLHLHADRFDACLLYVDAVADLGRVPDQPVAALLAGIAQLRQGQATDARNSFTHASELASAMINATPGAYAAHDVDALAQTGLHLCSEPGARDRALASFAQARAITSATGVTARISHLLLPLPPGATTIDPALQAAALGTPS